MVASSQRAFRDTGCSPTIPEVPIEISATGKLLMTTAGRPYCKPFSPLRRIAPIGRKSFEGRHEELRFDGAKAQEQISLA